MVSEAKAHENRKNFSTKLAERPEIAAAYDPLRAAVLGPGLLEKRIKTLAYLAASYANESPYDVAHFHALALEEGFSEDDIRAVRTEQDHVFPPMEHAAVRAARELTRNATLDDLEPNELDLFTNPQLVELVSVVALANFDNRFSLAMELEKE